MEYRYPHFERALMQEDSSFTGGPRPGEPFPDFDLPTTDGGRLRKTDFAGRQPLLMTFASVTCPMTADASTILRPLHERFGQQVAFVSLYVREAHPGENYPQPESSEEKLRHAQAYERRDMIPWPVAVDDIEGSLHRVLDTKPNAAYLIGVDGRVFARVLWSNDGSALRESLAALVSHRPLRHAERTGKVVPMLRGMGVMYDVLGDAGSSARSDVRREVPPLYGMARLAAFYRGLSAPGRSIAATATILCGVTVAGLTAYKVMTRQNTS